MHNHEITLEIKEEVKETIMFFETWKLIEGWRWTGSHYWNEKNDDLPLCTFSELFDSFIKESKWQYTETR